MKDITGEVLCVSQFTLFANLNKGAKVIIPDHVCLVGQGGKLTPLQPDFHSSAAPDIARPLYTTFVETIKAAYTPERVKDGIFGAQMEVNLVNDGPVTFLFDTAASGSVSLQKEREDKKKKWEEKKARGRNVLDSENAEGKSFARDDFEQ